MTGTDYDSFMIFRSCPNHESPVQLFEKEQPDHVMGEGHV